MGQWKRGRGKARGRMRVMIVGAVLAMVSISSAQAAWKKKAAEKSLANSVQAVAVQEENASTDIQITTSTPATYSVYLLLDPFRLMVDIVDAGLASGVPATLPVQNGVINSIQTSLITAADGTIARIEIGLDRKVEYEVDKQQNLLTLRVFKAAAPSTEEAPPSEAKSEGGGTVYVEGAGAAGESPLEWEAETIQEAEPAGEAAPPSATVPSTPALPVPTGPAKKLLDIAVDPRSDRTVVTIVTDGEVGDYNAFTLEKPARIVVDLWKLGNLYPSSRLQVNSQGIKGIRLGQHPNKVRLVFDASGATLPSYSFQRAQERLIVAFSSVVDVSAAPSAEVPGAFGEAIPPVPTAPAAAGGETGVAGEEAPSWDEAAGWEEAPAAAPPVPPLEQPAPPPAAGTRILLVDFNWTDAASSVVIKSDKPVKYDRVENPTDRIVSLLIHDAVLPKELERSLDTSEFQSPVNMVSSFQSTTVPPEVNVTVSLNNMVPSSVQQKGESLVIRFENTPGGLAAPELAPFPTEGEAAITPTPGAAAAPQPPTRAPGAEEYAGAPIYLDAKNMDVLDALRLIAEVSGLNIITADNVKGRITLKLDNVPWDQALDIILETKGLGMVHKGNIIRIAPIEQILAERSAEIKQLEDMEKLKPMKMKIVPVNYGKATEIQARLKSVLSPRGKAEVDRRTNSIIIRDIEQKLDEAEMLIAALDSPTPQVLIEARIVEASVGVSRQIGVQWGAHYNAGPAYGTPTGLMFPSSASVGGAVLGGVPAGSASTGTTGLSGGGGAMGFSFGSLTGVADLDLVLQALETQDQAKVISSPRIMTLNNEKATIEQGVTIPYPPAASLGGAAATWTFVEASLRLEVEPHVSADRSIVLSVKVSNNQPNLRVVSGGAPSIDKKEAKTEILIKDGDTAVIGGIYKINKSSPTTQVPYLGKLPVIGYLFKSRFYESRNDELLVFLTPRIIEATTPAVMRGI